MGDRTIRPARGNACGAQDAELLFGFDALGDCFGFEAAIRRNLYMDASRSLHTTIFCPASCLFGEDAQGSCLCRPFRRNLSVSLAIATPSLCALKSLPSVMRNGHHAGRCADLGRMGGQAECHYRGMLFVWQVLLGARAAKLPAGMMRTKSDYGARSVSTESEVWQPHRVK
jgi:hypothetical protein